MAALLQASAQVQLPKHKELTPAEERALKAMSIEEVGTSMSMYSPLAQVDSCLHISSGKLVG